MEEEYRERIAAIRRETEGSEVRKAARSIISAYLQVEGEASALRDRVAGRPPPRTTSVLTPMEEDYAIAMNLLSEYQTQKRQIPAKPSPEIQKKPALEYDPRINIEERHQMVQIRREERKAKQILSPTESKPGNQTFLGTDARLMELRAQRQKLEAEVQPEVLEEMRIQVRQEREELQAMDLLKKERERKLTEMESVSKQRERIAMEKEAAEKQILTMKRQRVGHVFEGVLGHYLFQNKAQGFRRMVWYSTDIRDKEIQFLRKDRFRRLSLTYKIWVVFVKAEIAEKAAETKRKAEEAEALRLDTADQHYKTKTYWKCWKLWMWFAVERKRQKEEEAEAEKRRRKIEILFEQMEQRRIAEIQIPEIMSEFSSFSISKSDQNVGTDPVSVSDRGETPVLTESIGTETALKVTSDESVEAVLVSPPSISEASIESQPIPQVPNMKKPTKISKQVLSMQKREEERKQGRELLKQKYREKEEKERIQKLEIEQKAAEEEIRKKREEAEKRRLEIAKKKEIEEKKREESARVVSLLKTADNFHKKSQKRYGLFLPWKKLVASSRKFQEISMKKGLFSTKRNLFRWLQLAVTESKRQDEEEDQRMVTLAESRFSLLRKELIFAAFQTNAEIEKQESGAFSQRRSVYLTSACFHQWKFLLPSLRTENDLRHLSETAKIRQFFLVRYI